MSILTIFENNSGYLLTALLLVVILSFVLNHIFAILSQATKRTKNSWDDLFLLSLKPPAQILLWYLWLYYSAYTLSKDYANIQPILSGLSLVPLLLIIWFFFRLVDNSSRQMSQNNAKLDKDSILLIGRLLKIFLILVSALMLAQYFGLSITSILTFGGMGGVIIGFAAKDMLANIFGGLMLQIDKPFSTGDWIRCDEKGFEGVVDKIGWRMTKIITFSKNPVYIPNSIFATIHIETPSRMTNRRIKTTIGVRYNDMAVVSLIVKDIKKYFNDNDYIDKNKTIIVNLNEFNAYSVDFLIYAFTKTTNWQEFHHIKQEVLFEINKIIEKHGAEIAFPTQKLHIHNEGQ